MAQSKVTQDTATTAPVPAAKLPRVKTCSGLAPFGLGEAGCKRLPRHKGEHRSFLHAAAARRAAKEAAATPKPAAKRRARKASPKVTTVKAAVVKRQVAAPSGRAKRTRFVTSGSPKLARPVVG
jgi:hypothetical protein